VPSGIEHALANDLIIAGHGSWMELPEVLSRLFPAMGSYRLFCRRLDAVRAQKQTKAA
jgi:enoyl-CoA hydratase/carnithine racemase